MKNRKILIVGILLAAGVLACSSDDQKVGARKNGSINAVHQEVQGTERSDPHREFREDLISEFDVGDARLRWTTRDVYLVGKDATATSLFLKPMAKAVKLRVARTANELSSSDLTGAEFYRDRSHLELRSVAQIKIKSLMGTIATFEVAYMSVLEGSPAEHSTRLLTLDLASKGEFQPFADPDNENTTGSGVDLAELFSEQDLVTAILENQKVRGNLNIERSVTTIDELLKMGDVRYGIDTGDNKYLNRYSLRNFVFDRIENEEIVVKMVLTTPGVSDTDPLQLFEVSLPIPENLRPQVLSAHARLSGFLGKDSETISQGRSSNLELRSPVAIENVDAI